MLQNFHISEMERKLANMIRIGTIQEVDHKKARVRVTVGNLSSDWLPWVTSHAGQVRNWSPPGVGTQVALLSPSGDLRQGIALPSLYQNAYPAPSDDPTLITMGFQDGTLLTYDQNAHALNVSLATEGKMKVTTGPSILEMTSDSITLKAPVIHINGKTFEGL